MKVIAPAYYRNFACIASACRHSCCIGWEVDIDDDSARKYAEMQHPYADKIRDSIEGEPPHFGLSKGERCPHLDASGLCRIITECGEEALCQICTDHPRYRNYYDRVVEIGLGLSCEEATRLVLESEVGFLVSDSEDMSGAEYRESYPTDLFSDEDIGIVEQKARLLSLVSDSRKTIEERIESLLPKRPDFDEIKALYLSLDILDAEWENRIKTLSAEDFNHKINAFSIMIERTLCALIYRHASGESFYEPRTVGAFAALSAMLVAALSKSAEDFPDTLRAYSAEVEYSTENTEKIMDFLEERI